MLSVYTTILDPSIISRFWEAATARLLLFIPLFLCQLYACFTRHRSGAGKHENHCATNHVVDVPNHRLDEAANGEYDQEHSESPPVYLNKSE